MLSNSHRPALRALFKKVDRALVRIKVRRRDSAQPVRKCVALRHQESTGNRMTAFSELRQKAGMSLTDAVVDFGRELEIVMEWESGNSSPPGHVLRALRFLNDTDTLERRAHQPADSNNYGGQDSQGCFSWHDHSVPISSPKKTRTGTFTDNMKLPVHRWFRYSAGFSAEWVSGILDRRGKGNDEFLFDPFAGSGTAMLAAKDAGVCSAGAERHSFVHRIASAKLSSAVDTASLRTKARNLLETARRIKPKLQSAPALLRKCYSPEVLARLEALRLAWLGQSAKEDEISELLWLAITSILRECSGVGTAQWQYVLPNKTKTRVAEPYAAFERRVEMFIADIIAVRAKIGPTVSASILLDDARALSSFAHLEGRVTLVVTSPPYPNNYDYADATRLEMTFWREVGSWSDLQRAVRRDLVRSCSQHSAAEQLSLDTLLAEPAIDAIRDELSAVCRELEAVREWKGGRKTYHTMVAAYFVDLAKAWHALRPLCAAGSDICFVIGDSAPYGVYVPVDDWLAKLGLAAGFTSPRFEKIRDRNLKWKNRKHRVPLKEGNLWLRG